MPYLLPFGKEYTNGFITSLESDLNACSNEAFRFLSEDKALFFQSKNTTNNNNFETISHSEVNNLEYESIFWVLRNLNKNRDLRIELLNSPKSRDIEFKIIEVEKIINKIYNDFLSYYKLNIRPNQIAFPNIFNFSSFFTNKNPIKKCKCLWRISEEIMEGTGISLEMHDSEILESFYLKSSDLLRWQSIISHYKNKIYTLAINRRKLVNEYLKSFDCLSKDPRDDNYIVVNFREIGYRKINKNQLPLFKEKFSFHEKKRLEDKLKAEIKEFTINRIQMAISRDRLVMGGDIILYYLRLIYPGREKPLYKIGITRRSIEERYPGQEFKKIDKVLFSEYIIDAEKIESDIKRLYSNHAIPIAIFRESSGKTEFFDIDVLGIDVLERPPQNLGNP